MITEAQFARSVADHQQAVRAFLRRLSGHAAEADDLAQEVFVAAWQNIERFDGSDMRAWLNGIAYRKFLTARRGWFRRLKRDGASLEGVEQSVAPGVQVELRLDLARAMQTLPLEQRAAVALCLGEGATHEEAAQTLNLPLGTVKSHILRGREKLVTALKGHTGGRDG